MWPIELCHCQWLWSTFKRKRIDFKLALTTYKIHYFWSTLVVWYLHKYTVTPINMVSSITNNLPYIEGCDLPLPMNAAFIYGSLSVTTARFSH